MTRSIEDRLMTGDADPGMYPDIAERLGMFPEPEQPQEQPEPTTEELCEPHLYHGDDSQSGRCYCGTKRYRFGGAEIEGPFR
jgi:hypothetical protein